MPDNTTSDRLRRLFNETFDAVPSRVAAKLQEFWRRYRVPTITDRGTERFVPELHLQNIILEVKDEPANANPSLIAQGVAQAQRVIRSLNNYGQSDGVVFRFRKRLLELAPDDIIKPAIAHELGHAYRAAEVGVKFPEAARIRAAVHFESEADEESAANALAKEWGFNIGRTLAWIDDNKSNLRHR